MKKFLSFVLFALIFVTSLYEPCSANWVDDLKNLHDTLSVGLGGQALKVVLKKRQDEGLRMLTIEEMIDIANGGNVDAQFYLGRMYYQNVIGRELSEHDRIRASIDWFSKALEQGDSEAASMLGLIFVDLEQMQFRKDALVYQCFYLAYLLDKSPETRHNIDIWEESTLWGLGWQVMAEEEVRKGRAEAEKSMRRSGRNWARNKVEKK